MKRIGIAALGLVALLALAMPVAAQADYVVIVNSSHAENSVAKDELAQLFLGINSRWAGGQEAEPVDQSISAPVRRAFCKAVLDEDVEFIASYWNSMVAAGNSKPPKVKTSDAEVVDFVGATAGAVGYVSPGTPLGTSVKVLKVR